MKHLLILLTLSFTTILFIGCNKANADKNRSTPNKKIVEVTARGMTFEAPDKIFSGWTTFHFKNESPMTHFYALEKMPTGITLDEWSANVAPVFQDIIDAINEGEDPTPYFGRLPAWFSKIEWLGGPGLVAPNHIATTTVKLEPGTYVIECYVKTNGVFHSYLGMYDQIIVTEASSNASPPAADLNLTISSTTGIEIDGKATTGEQTIAVYFKDQKLHEHFLGHDVHLVRLEENTDLDELAAWMNWMNPKGMQTPAPAEFLGGVQEMPAGRTAYFTVEFEPGRYAWISEVPNPDEKGMLKTFTLPSDN